MKKALLILIIATLFTCSNGSGQTRSIRFIDKPWTEILTQAEKENKLIFLDAFASWCGPCKWMAANIFTNDTVADYYNDNFICVSLDMEKGEGVKLRSRYEVRYYPTLLFLNPKGELVHQRVGAARKAMDYIKMGKTALDPTENLAASLKRYNSGEKSDAFIQSLLLKLSEAYLPVQPVLLNYFSEKNDQEMLSRGTWNIILDYVSDPEIPQFDYLINHKQEYGNLFGRDSVNKKISDVYLSTLMNLSRPNSPTDSGYHKLKAKIRRSGVEGAEKIIFTADLYYHQMRGETQKFLEMAHQGVDQYYGNDPTSLNTYAYTFYQICTQQKPVEANRYLEKALGWAKKSVALKKEPANLDTYSSLLFATGNIPEAIKHEKEAISLARKLSVPLKKYEETLKMMEDAQEKK